MAPLHHAGGGDFIEFRFLVPILPLCFILIGWVIFAQVQSVVIRVALVALILIGSLHHAHAFLGRPSEIESITLLSRHLEDEGDGWIRIGRTLGAAFGHDPGITVAVTAAGAIPYYSRLTTIDMLGLNDRQVAREGPYLGSSKPGHRRMATLGYLLQRGVNLVIAHPQTMDRHAAWVPTRTSVL